MPVGRNLCVGETDAEKPFIAPIVVVTAFWKRFCYARPS